MKKVQLKIKGWYCNCRRKKISRTKGIYFVYTCVCKYCITQTITVHKLIYIGSAIEESIPERLCRHEKNLQFEETCQDNEGLCYTYIPLNDETDDAIRMYEQALIFAEKPELNDQNKDNYDKDDIEIQLEGCVNVLPQTHFQIKDGKLL